MSRSTINHDTEDLGRGRCGRRYLALGIDLSDVPCLVVGGGRIGARKALKLLEHGARVTVLSPEIADRLREPVQEGRIRWIRARYTSEHLGGFAIVVAATSDPALNVAIGNEARLRGAFCCIVSPGTHSQVVFPALYEKNDIVVAVHSNGTDCARSRKVRDEIAANLGTFRGHPGYLAVAGVKRANLPRNIFGRLVMADALPHDRSVWNSALLNTCQRWEWYATTDRPVELYRGLLRFLESAGARPDLARHAYLKAGIEAYHHLLRVACGLDSPLVGEYEVVTQVRAAQPAKSGTRDGLALSFAAALRDQEWVRRVAGLPRAPGHWAGRIASVVEDICPDLSGRRVALVGCGRLARDVAGVLLARGARPVAVSKRSGRIPWCAAMGIEQFSQQDLGEFLERLDGLVLFSQREPEIETAILRRVTDGKAFAIDVTPRASTGTQPSNVRWVGLDDVTAGKAPTVKEALRIAHAERLCVLAALRWHLREEPAVPVPARLRLGCRASDLSRAQAEEVLAWLRLLAPECEIETVLFQTPGDRDKVTPLTEVGEEDFFTRDIDNALLSGAIDVALHSTKDLPRTLRTGLVVAAVTPAFAPWEALVTSDGRPLKDLPSGAVVGISSERRRAAIEQLRPDLRTREVRGDVPDRLRQIDAGSYDALILAAAGLFRLGLEHRIAQIFSLHEIPPAPGQGSLALVTRIEDEPIRRFLEPLDLGEWRS